MGIKYSHVIASFFGAMVSLNFTRRVGAFAAVISVFGGLACAVYTAPLVVHYFSIEKDSAIIGINFLVGVFGLNILSGFSLLAKNFSLNPLGAIAKIRSSIGGGG